MVSAVARSGQPPAGRLHGPAEGVVSWLHVADLTEEVHRELSDVFAGDPADHGCD